MQDYLPIMFQYLILEKHGTLTFPQFHACGIAEKMMTDKLYMGPRPFNFAVFSKRGGDGLRPAFVYKSVSAPAAASAVIQPSAPMFIRCSSDIQGINMQMTV